MFDAEWATMNQPAQLEDYITSKPSVRIDGQEQTVYETPVAWFVTLSVAHKVSVSVHCQSSINKVIVRPLRYSIDCCTEGNSVSFFLDTPMNLSVEIDQNKPLFVFASAPQRDIPDRNDPNVLYFGGGGVHKIPLVELSSGQTLYIEEGTTLKAKIKATGADSITIAGRGIIDGSGELSDKEKKRSVLFQRCTNVRIEGVVLIDPVSWMIVLTCCDGVVIDGIREIGTCMSSDGIDVVGSSNVLICNSFLRNNDDCVVIKGAGYEGLSGDVDNVVVEHCTFLNAHSGNVMEIGYETRCDRISNVVFRDIDVIGAHGEGGVFTIHNAERALVTDILFEDIRVEHFYDRLIDLRVFWSRYSREEQRGQIRNVVFRSIQTIANRFNVLSLIGGDDADHTVERVVIEDFSMGGKPVANADQLNLYVKHAADVVIRSSKGECRVC